MELLGSLGAYVWSVRGCYLEELPQAFYLVAGLARGVRRASPYLHSRSPVPSGSHRRGVDAVIAGAKPLDGFTRSVTDILESLLGRWQGQRTLAVTDQ